MNTYECPDCNGRFRADDSPDVCPICGYEPELADGPGGTRGGFVIAHIGDNPD